MILYNEFLRIGYIYSEEGLIEHSLRSFSLNSLRSFNDTGDRVALTTLARQPNYPSMPLRPEDCRMTLAKKDKRLGTIGRHSSMNEAELSNPSSLIVSPTYSMYSSTAKSSNYFITDDEAVSRF